MKLRSSLITTLAALLLPLSLQSAELMPSFADIPGGWATDRYAPTSFLTSPSYQGRSDVLGITITSAGNLANRPAPYQSGFYNTQGMQHAISGGAGSTLSADLYIPGSWGDPINGNIRTDMWGILNAPSVYPIIGFTNYGGSARLRLWDADTANGWVNLATSVTYDAWTSFSIQFTGSSFIYSVNGNTVYTDSTTSGVSGFTGVIMQGYNFADSAAAPGAILADYTAHWSNTPVPDVHSTIALLGMTFAAVFGLRRRFGS